MGGHLQKLMVGLFFAATGGSAAFASDCVSVNSGRWQSPGTWLCSPGVPQVPGPGDTVVVDEPHTVTVLQSAVVDWLRVDGVLEIDPGAQLFAIQAIVQGQLQIKGTLVTTTPLGVINNGSVDVDVSMGGELRAYGGVVVVGAGSTVNLPGIALNDTPSLVVSGNLVVDTGASVTVEDSGTLTSFIADGSDTPKKVQGEGSISLGEVEFELAEGGTGTYKVDIEQSVTVNGSMTVGSGAEVSVSSPPRSGRTASGVGTTVLHMLGDVTVEGGLLALAGSSLEFECTGTDTSITSANPIKFVTINVVDNGPDDSCSCKYDAPLDGEDLYVKDQASMIILTPQATSNRAAAGTAGTVELTGDLTVDGSFEAKDGTTLILNSPDAGQKQVIGGSPDTPVKADDVIIQVNGDCDQNINLDLQGDFTLDFPTTGFNQAENIVLKFSGGDLQDFNFGMGTPASVGISPLGTTSVHLVNVGEAALSTFTCNSEFNWLQAADGTFCCGFQGCSLPPASRSAAAQAGGVTALISLGPVEMIPFGAPDTVVTIPSDVGVSAIDLGDNVFQLQNHEGSTGNLTVTSGGSDLEIPPGDFATCENDACANRLAGDLDGDDDVDLRDYANLALLFTGPLP